MVCGKGGYVRSIARDLGRVLGCLGHVESLRRLWSGPFTLAGAVTWAEIEAAAGTDALDARHPLAATLLRRAVIGATLAAARTARYAHAARHLDAIAGGTAVPAVRATGRFAPKLQALWIAGYDLNAI